MNRKSFFRNLFGATAATTIGNTLDWIPEPEPIKPGLGGKVFIVRLDSSFYAQGDTLTKNNIWMHESEWNRLQKWEEERQKKLAEFMWGNYQKHVV